MSQLYVFVIVIACIYCVKCENFPYTPGYISQFRNQFNKPRSQNYGSQNLGYGSSVQADINIKQYLVPVALISSAATPVSYPPLRISVKGNAELLATNNGSKIAIIGSGGETSIPTGGSVEDEAATLTGGPINNKVFVFGRLNIRNDARPNATRVSVTEDGVGFPMQVNVFFYDPIYGTLRNAHEHKNGVVIISFNILVEGIIPNPLFEPYRSAMAQLSNPFTNSTISSYGVFEWLLPTLTSGYYVYPGSFIAGGTAKQIPGTIIISPNFNKHPWLSYTQWEVIEQLLSGNYQQMANPLPLFPLAGRFFGQANSPVYCSYK